MLSTKLIHAINHGTGLDDTLHTVRQELAVAYRRLEELDNVNERYSQDIANGALLKKAEVDATIQLMRRELGDARRQREEAEKAKKQMESEVENLTASLFEQANTVSTCSFSPINVIMACETNNISDGCRCKKRKRSY